MKVTNEKTENHQAFLKIEVEADEVEASKEKTFRKLVKQVNVPGFRKGKAPRPVFERHFGADQLFREALDDLVPDVYVSAIKEQKLDPVADPQIEMESDDPLVIKATIPLRPVVNLGDYKTIDLKPESVEVTDEMLDSVIEQLRHQHATWEPADRAVEFNDLAVFDVESTMKEQPFINQKGAQYQVVKDSTAPVVGFAEQLVGMKKEEEKEFTIKYPDDYQQKEIAGNEAVFKVKMTEIKQEKLPEVNDEFAKQVNPEVGSIDDLRKLITEDMTKRLEENVKSKFEDKVVEEATKLSKVEYPPILVDAEVQSSLERNLRFLQNSGQNIENYLKSIDKTVDQLREELRPASQTRVEQSLVIGKIAEQEKIDATNEEIEAEIEEMVKTSSGDKDELKQILHNERNLESIKDNLIARKTVQHLTEIAQSKKETKKDTKKED